MPIGKYADYLVRVGKAKRVTKEEFLARLQAADDRGFMNYKTNPVKPATETAKVLSMVVPDPFHKNKPWKW